MKGMPIILHGSLISDSYDLEGPGVTVRSDDSSTDFSFTGKIGRDKIVKVPVEGAKGIWFNRKDGGSETLTDAFDNPLPVSVSVPYSIVENDFNGKWLIVYPFTQQKEVKLSESAIAKILSLRL